MRKWILRGAGIAAGAVIAGGLGAAGQWQGGLAGAAVIAVGGFVAPEVSDWLDLGPGSPVPSGPLPITSPRMSHLLDALEREA